MKMIENKVVLGDVAVPNILLIQERILKFYSYYGIDGTGSIERTLRIFFILGHHVLIKKVFTEQKRV